MKRSASEAELSSEQESLEATQRVLGLDHGNVGEGSIQAAQAIGGGSISGVAVPPTQAGLGLESHSSQEWPNAEERGGIAGPTTQENVEETSLQANMDQPTPTALPSLLNLEGISMDDIHDLLHPSVEERDILEEIVQIATGQVEASHQEPAVGINDRIVLQAPPSDMNNQRNGQVEASQQEDKEAGIVPRAPNVGLVVLEEPIGGEEDTGVQARTHSQQTQNSLPQQGTARRRILLQVPLGGAKGLSEPKHASEQEVELFPTEPLQHATNSCSGGTTAEESHAKEPLSAEGLISDHPDVVQQTGQYVSGFSSASCVHLPLGFPGDACILHASGELPYDTQEMSFGSEDGVNGQQSMTCHQNNAGPFLRQRLASSSSIKEAKVTKMHYKLNQDVSDRKCRKPCRGCGSSHLALCLFWTATLALIVLCLFCSFCRLIFLWLVTKNNLSITYANELQRQKGF